MNFAPTRMRGLLSDRENPGRFLFRELDRPSPATNEILVRVNAISLDRGEILQAMSSPTGAPLGSDLAGTIEIAAADGSGLPVGARVAGLVQSGSCAQFIAISSDALAEIPAKVSFAQAAALPVAGLTALYALESGGLLVGKSVLVCGAEAAGIYALQLAHLSGAHVTAFIPRALQEAIMEEYGADRVVVGNVIDASPVEGYDLVIAAAESRVVNAVLPLMHVGSTCVLYGISDARMPVLDRRALVGRGIRLQGLALFDATDREPLAEGLVRLFALVETHALRTPIELEVDWKDIGTAGRQLLDRIEIGKVVIRVG